MNSQESPWATTERAAQWQALMQRWQRVITRLKAHPGHDTYHVLDPQLITHTLMAWSQALWTRPDKLWEQQWALCQDMVSLWQKSWTSWLLKTPAQPTVEPARGDKRFKDDTWTHHALFDFIKQAYLITTRHMLDSVEQTEGLDAHTREKAAFYLRQYVDALSPTNFVASNPQILKETIESQGGNLIKGMHALLDDLERGEGRLAIKMTDTSAFRLGENIAVTPGQVIYQNELMQLIQYAPSTEKVFQRPLLIIPPWINKYYILDLKPKNSLIKWAVDQGHTVFVISWINPDESLRHKHFEDYMLEGPLAALGAIEQATGVKEVKAMGYCIGGTLLASTLAYMTKTRDTRIKAATLMTSLLDFSDIGELAVFVDEEQIARMEAYMNQKGYLEGHHMADVFNLLRENDLIWAFVINNYLLGREPMAFDLLYWNSDSTRMPAEMHSFYLRNMYLDNRLREPGGITLAGMPIDLTRIKTPAYWISTREDHIAPWKTTYLGTRLLQGPKRFVLGGSGHIAGIVNPPAANKYGYCTNENLEADADIWLAGATEHEGSWWLDWAEWVASYNGKEVPARQLGDGQLRPLEPSPGSYVKVRLL